ncbi:MAG: transglutaminase-like domain-containing protein [Acidobacteriota bacterium]
MSAARAARRRWSRVRVLVIAAIAGFWLVMTGLLLIRQGAFAPIAESPRASTPLDGPRDVWLVFTTGPAVSDAADPTADAAAIAQRAIGYANVRQQPAMGPGDDPTTASVAGQRWTATARLQLPVLGRSAALDLFGSVWRPDAPDAAPTTLVARIDAAGQAVTVDGRLSDGRLRGTIDTAGERVPLDVPLDDARLFDGGLGLTLSLPDLAVGEQIEMRGFNPLMPGAGARVTLTGEARETLVIAGETWSARRIAIDGDLLGRATAWVDDDGEVLRAETPLGLHLERVPRAVALASLGEDGSVSGARAAADDLLRVTAIVPEGPRPRRGVTRLTLRLTGADGAPLPASLAAAIPSDDVQSWDPAAGLLRVDVPPLPAAGSMLAAASAGAIDAASDPHLAGDPFVQVDHPEIRAQASSIVGDASDRWMRALRLHEWVFAEIEKVPVLSLPSALDVLRQRAGDCNEHTILYAALARAVDVPTRVAIGVVWSDAYGGFYYHAWPEVRLDAPDGASRWVRLDPTLGQVPADATHVKLLTGGIERWPQLVAYLGRLAIEVVMMEDAA